MDIYFVEAIVTICGSAIGAFKYIPRFYNWIIRPRIRWGFFDCPNSNETHFYILIKKIKPEDFEQHLKLIFEPKIFSLDDYNVSVHSFYTPSGYERNCEIDINAVAGNNIKEFNLKLPCNQLYRIIVKCEGGRLGYFPSNNFVLKVKAEGAVVPEKVLFSRFKKYIKF